MLKGRKRLDLVLGGLVILGLIILASFYFSYRGTGSEKDRLEADLARLGATLRDTRQASDLTRLKEELAQQEAALARGPFSRESEAYRLVDLLVQWARENQVQLVNIDFTAGTTKIGERAYPLHTYELLVTGTPQNLAGFLARIAQAPQGAVIAEEIKANPGPQEWSMAFKVLVYPRPG